MSKTLRSFAIPVLGGLVGSAVLGPAGFGLASAATGGAAGAALGSGANTYSQTHNIGQALLSGGGSFVGSQVAGNVLGDKLGTVGGTLNSGLGSGLGGTAANFIGPTLANTTLSSILGGNIGSSVASGLVPDKAKNPMGESAAPAPFKPSQADAQQLPASLAGLSTLTPAQQASNVATGGVYGGGQGPQENSYFLNLINRQMFDDSGNVKGLDNINPIENSYLKQLGISGYGNSTDLLKQIQGWHQ